MSTEGAQAASPGTALSEISPWLIAICGYVVMYVPVYWWAANTIWQTEEHGHGPLILAVLLWLAWSLRKQLLQAPTSPAPALWWPLLAMGVLLYVVGRAFGISIFDIGSRKRDCSRRNGAALVYIA